MSAARTPDVTAASGPTATEQTATGQHGGMKRVVTAAMVGTTIEWYDFFLFGSAAALVFNTLFFPEADPLVGTLLAFATYAVGFVARPLGGLVFGHYGDRVGRKKMLVISLLLMGGATFAIGLLPTYDAVGALAPALLVLLRLVQGFAVGGEWGGAVLLVSERGSSKHRGFWASLPQAGVPAGNLLAVAVLFVLAATTSDEAFQTWGWRVPFLLSAVLVLFGMYVRLSVAESPVFQQAQAQAQAEARGAERRAPALEVLTRYRREVLVAMGARFVENASYYVFTVFVLTYVTEHLGLEKQVALNAVLVGSAVHFLAIPFWGAVSDRLGRRPVYLFGAVGVAIWAFAFFTMVDTRSGLAITGAVVVALVLHAAMYGPQAAYFSELFGTSVRYSGASMGYQLASVVSGSLAPIIAVALLARYASSIPVSLYVVGCAVLTVTAVLLSRETRGEDLGEDPGPATAPGGTTQPDATATHQDVDVRVADRERV